MKQFQPRPNPEDLVFVDLLSDTGFKLVYANPANKSLLINLLNIVLPDDMRVSDIVEYRDREQNPDSFLGKKTILDLVCRDLAGNIFCVEVQRKIDSAFGKRCVYYASGQYHSQLRKGQRYEELHPVFEIAFLEEQIPHADETLWDTDNIISRYQIAEMSTGESLGSTIFIIFAELGRFSKSAEECLTVKDKLFYWFKNASCLKDAPAWTEDPELSALMTATEIAAFPPEKKDIYIKNIMNERDIEYQQKICFDRGLKQGLEQGMEQGLVRGREEGRETGARENALKTAKALLQNGIAPDIIARCTGLSIEDIR